MMFSFISSFGWDSEDPQYYQTIGKCQDPQAHLLDQITTELEKYYKSQIICHYLENLRKCDLSHTFSDNVTS